MTQPRADRPSSVVALAFAGMDLMDLVGPIEALLTCNRLLARQGEPEGFQVVVAAVDERPAVAYGNLAVLAQDTVARALLGSIDYALIPGSIDLANLRSPQVRDAVQALAASGCTMCSVCTGAFALADAGLLEGKAWTTHWEDIALLRGHDRITTPAQPGRVVGAPGVLTAGGLTCGIDLGLALVDQCQGRVLAHATAKQLDYPWQPPN